MRISAINPSLQRKSDKSFGLRTDKATQDLVLNSNISETAKILFKNMLLDRETDRFTITIKENAVKDSFKFILGLKDKKYPFAKEEKKGFEAFNDYIAVRGKNDLADMIESIFYPEGFDSYGKGLEFTADTIIKPRNESIKARFIGVPQLFH